jgi:hypothetical protein
MSLPSRSSRRAKRNPVSLLLFPPMGWSSSEVRRLKTAALRFDPTESRQRPFREPDREMMLVKH